MADCPQFNKEHKNAILAMFDNMPAGTLPDDLLLAYVALRHLNVTQYVDVYINVPPGLIIDGIKMLRSLTGMGIFEAKKWYIDKDPTRDGGVLGPVLRCIPMEDAEALRCKFTDQMLTALVFEPCK